MLKLLVRSVVLSWNVNQFALRKGNNSNKTMSKEYNFRIKSETGKWSIVDEPVFHFITYFEAYFVLIFLLLF